MQALAIKREAHVVTQRFSKINMICSSMKPKLLIVGPRSHKHSKPLKNYIFLNVNVCAEIKQGSVCEKLLGVTRLISNESKTKKSYFVVVVVGVVIVEFCVVVVFLVVAVVVVPEQNFSNPVS